MTKQEIRQIIERGWQTRRDRQVERSKKNSVASKKWQEREKTIDVEEENLKRWKHYLGLK